MYFSRRDLLVLGSAFLAGCSAAIPPAPGATSPNHDRGRHNGRHQWLPQTQRRPAAALRLHLEAAARSPGRPHGNQDQLDHDLGVTLRQRAVTTTGSRGAVAKRAGAQQTLEQAISGWLNSPGHRATLLSTIVEFGLTVAKVPRPQVALRHLSGPSSPAARSAWE
jgi:hypothetical protein